MPPVITEQHCRSRIKAQTQTTEVNTANSQIITGQENISVVDMSEDQQQTYQPANLYDVNDSTQRDELLRSLEKNPHMLYDFYQFLEYTRARSAHLTAQSGYTGATNQEQQQQQQHQIPTLLANSNININKNAQFNSSTPKKRDRPLNESGGSMSSAPKQFKQNNISIRNQPRNITATNELDRRNIPFEQLKRAVSSNLPCFYVEFEQQTTSNRLPSACEARNLIENHFKDKKIRIQHFSLVGWMNKRLKLGVSNKEDYLTLVTSDNWPSTIKNIPVKIIKPKFIPDCFALVVRYVPGDFETDFVKEEIQRYIASAENIKLIHYAYERKSNDFRFNVSDLSEYKTALELGRISIGNRLLAITPFLTGNRMTYCTRCWKIGHMREQCRTNTQRCRTCLEEITNREQHVCTNVPKCAQCEGEHHSLNGQCHVIQRYRADLKVEVNKALEAGKLRRNEDSTSQTGFNMKNQEFPQLNEVHEPQQTTWGNTQTELINKNTSELTNAILLINNNLADMRESNRRVEEKLDKISNKLKQSAADIELHHTTVYKLIEYVKVLISNVISPITAKIQPNLIKCDFGLHAIQDKLIILNSELRNGYEANGYETKRKQAESPTAQDESIEITNGSDNKLTNKSS